MGLNLLASIQLKKLMEFHQNYQWLIRFLSTILEVFFLLLLLGMRDFKCAQQLCLMLHWFSGSALEKAGGSEFKEEVKKLSESHGPLELATGMF